MKRKTVISRIAAAALAVCAALSLASCQAAPAPSLPPPPKADINITALAGPASASLKKIMEDQQNGRAANNYSFKTAETADEIAAALASGGFDVAAVPCGLAAALYNGAGGIKAAAVNNPGTGGLALGDESGAVIVRTEFWEENKAAVNTFIREYRVSAESAGAGFIGGDEMKTALSGYLSALYESAPESVGGSLPGDDFYLILLSVSPEGADEPAAPVTEAPEPEAEQEAPKGGIFTMEFMSQVLIWGGVILVGYFFLFRQPRKEAKKKAEMRDSIKVGDNIMTNSGLFGKVVEIGVDSLTVEFGTNRGVRVPVLKEAVEIKREPVMTAPAETE